MSLTVKGQFIRQSSSKTGKEFFTCVLATGEKCFLFPPKGYSLSDTQILYLMSEATVAPAPDTPTLEEIKENLSGGVYMAAPKAQAQKKS